ncbi:MAG: glycosyltransferase family 2 protein [Actinobacteria bacterium]|nr:glycosyltransferase family 2 protein [Actinomycetota bacterium]
MPQLSVIIVTHNTKTLIQPLLSSLFSSIKYWGKETEIIVVDNASNDGTTNLIRKKYPTIKLIENKSNHGYAKANNQGIKIAKGVYILLLNSDVILRPDVLKRMISYLEKNQDVGIITCKLVLPNDTIDPACHRGFPTPWASLTYFLGLERLFPKISLFSQYHLWYKPLNTIHEIDSPSGAFYLIRKKIIDSIGYLDEKFFMYGEDLDWSYRIKKAGWKIIFNPQAQITHLKKQSGLKSLDLKTRENTSESFYQAMKVFYDKHYRNNYPSYVRYLIFMVIDFKKMIDRIKLKLLWI